jgi:hypothetical protein
VSAANSSLTAAPGTITAGGPGATITVTARDQSGNGIPGAVVVLAAITGAGSFSAVPPTNASGVTTATYTSTVAGGKLIGATINGVTIDNEQPITVVAAAPSIAQSTLEVSPTQIPVNGTAVATVTARDQFGNLVTGADVTVSITNGGAVPPAGQTAAGVFATDVTSSTVGTQTVSATVEGAALPDAQLDVVAIVTTTALTTSGSPSLVGESVTFTATVSGAVTPTGIVSFFDGGTCGAPGAPLGNAALAGGQAAVATSALSAGSHTVLACYAGTPQFAPSSDAVSQEVNEPANEAPTAVGHAFGTNEDVELSIAAPGVRSGAGDTDGSVASASVVTTPAHGSLALDPDGSFTYTPDADYAGADEFTYRVFDDDGAPSAPATVSLTVAPVNDPPTFGGGAPQSAAAGDGPQVAGGWLTGISAGPGEGAQSVAFQVTTSDDAAFASLPSVASDGTLTWAAAAVIEPTAVMVTVVAQDDGGTANGGADSSAPYQVTFTILP